ncbi:hypothetical protein GCM10027262_19090 [Nocardia tengchongensis]
MDLRAPARPAAGCADSAMVNLSWPVNVSPPKARLWFEAQMRQGCEIDAYRPVCAWISGYSATPRFVTKGTV